MVQAMSNALWAPWRMEYVLTPKRTGTCPFCEMPERGIERFREDLVLVVQPHAYVCLNMYPFAAGHLLVCTRAHAGKLTELSDEAYDGFMRLLRDTVERVERVAKPDGMNVGLNLGTAGGAGFADHLHAHVVPRWVGDVNFMPVLAETRVLPEHLDRTWVRLRAVFEDVDGIKGPVST